MDEARAMVRYGLRLPRLRWILGKNVVTHLVEASQSLSPDLPGGIIQIQRTLISSPHVMSNACNERMLERCVSQFVMAHRMVFIKAFIVHAMFRISYVITHTSVSRT